CSIKIWDRWSGELLSTLDNSYPISGFVLSPNGRWGFAVSSDCRVRAWDLIAHVMIAEFSCDSPITNLGVTLDCRTIVGGDAAGFVHFVRLEGADGQG